VTVTGSNLDSVAEPRITVTVVITTSYNDTTNLTSSKNETDSEVINDDGGSLQTYERFVACKCQIQSRSCFFWFVVQYSDIIAAIDILAICC